MLYVGIVSQYQSNPGPNHWVVVKHILKYLRRTKDYMLVYCNEDLTPLSYTDFDFQLNRDSRKSMSRSVFTLGGGTIVWRSIKQSCIVNSTWRPNMWLPVRLPRKWFDSSSSLGVLRLSEVWIGRLYYIVIIQRLS